MTPARPAGELESELRDRHALDAALVAISRRLVGASSDTIDHAIEAALRILAEAMGTDRTYVSRLSPDGARLTVTHEFHAAGRSALRNDVKEASTAGMEWVFDPLRARQVVVVRSIDEVPPEQTQVRWVMTQLDLRSFVVAPMILADRVVGTIGFEWSTRAPPLLLSTAPLVLAGELIAEVLARARTEHELRVTRDRLRSFVSSTREAVVCFEVGQGVPIDQPFDAIFAQLQQAPLVECNASYARMKGVDDPRALLGKTLGELTVIPTEQLRSLFGRMVDGGYRVQDMEVTGAEGTFLFGAQAMVSEGRLTHWWSLLRDVTEQRKAEAQRAALQTQLRHAQKMESIGVLAGGVAHDFNNILLVIDAESSIALEELRSDPDAAESAIGQLRKASARASDLTRRLLTFSRQQPQDHRALDVEAVTAGVLAMLRRLIRAEVRLEHRVTPKLPTIRGDAGQLEQVLVNLAVNAADAIQGVGRILIEIDDVVLDEDFVRLHPWARSGTFVRLAVSDDGAGIAPELRERIFEPFFTTKPTGKGTGLGLSMVYGIVQQHQGFVHLYSEVGAGSTFRVYLPVDHQEVARVERPAKPTLPGGHETILVAEDDELVRSVVDRILQRAGYRVILARDGAEALALLERHADDIHLLLLDAVMPVVSGDQVYAQVRVERPTLPVLVSSGYTTASFPEGTFEGPMLSKPYDIHELLRRVRHILDAVARPSSADEG